VQMMRYLPEAISELRTCLRGRPDNMKVEVERGVPVIAKTVADLRSLATWPPGLVLVVHNDLDPGLASSGLSGSPDLIRRQQRSTSCGAGCLCERPLPWQTDPNVSSVQLLSFKLRM
jgi:hypothetical protein